MARYTGPKCRLCRREGMKLFLKGRRCDSAKCPFEGTKQRNFPPGARSWQRGKTSTYARGLREKQKLKRFYGLLEKPFKIYFREAQRKRGNTGEALLISIERRLDNVVRRLGLGLSVSHSRQLVSHGHIFVNDKRVNVPSYEVRPGDKITVSKHDRVRNVIREAVELNRRQSPPSWLEFNPDELAGKVVNIPTVDEVQLPLAVQLVVEHSSR